MIKDILLAVFLLLTFTITLGTILYALGLVGKREMKMGGER